MLDHVARVNGITAVPGGSGTARTARRAGAVHGRYAAGRPDGSTGHHATERPGSAALGAATPLLSRAAAAGRAGRNAAFAPVTIGKASRTLLAASAAIVDVVVEIHAALATTGQPPPD